MGVLDSIMKPCRYYGHIPTAIFFHDFSYLCGVCDLVHSRGPLAQLPPVGGMGKLCCGVDRIWAG